MSTRKASHAGSWYENDQRVLSAQLGTWLENGRRKAPTASRSAARAVIAPHAGYSYCGEVAGYAYSQIDPTHIKTVFILGPSHHVYINGIALSECKTFRTPLGDLNLDEDIYARLKANKNLPFESMSVDDDEAEHSLEMHMPFVAKVFENRRNAIKIVPLVVGNTSKELERRYGEALLPFLLDASNLFIISSDFCHWGRRFRYTPQPDKSVNLEIFQFIENLDREGMQIIETRDPTSFRDYLQRTENTICGRNPIIVLLNMLKAADSMQQQQQQPGSSDFDLKFLNYAQSSKCRSSSDSSVSYAAAALYSPSSAADGNGSNNHHNHSSSRRRGS